MAYLGNLTCTDCGVTFTARWGSFAGADEYRCANDHVVYVDPESGALLGLDDDLIKAPSVVDLRGRCPLCSEELMTGQLPACPVCGGRDHEVAIAGSMD